MKSMKKIIALVLAIVLVAGCFAACAKKDSSSEKSSDKAAAEDMKVGFIFLHDENSTYDKNFIDAAKQACEELGIAKENVIMKTGIGEDNACYEAAADLVDQGCKYVFADSFGHESYMAQAAKEFKDVQFCHATGTTAHTAGLKNFHNAFANIYEGRYLAGIAAGMKLKELKDAGKLKGDVPKMGYVGAFTYAEVMSGYTSFYLGAKSIVDDVIMDVTFTGSWYDQAKEQEAAEKLIKDGKCDLISQHADSMGAPSACESAGIPNVSYNGSTVKQCPNTFIVSSKINWVPYFKDSIQKTMDGKGDTIGVDFTGTIADGSVELTEVNEKAAAKGTQEAIDAAIEELKAGTLNVYDVKNFTVTVNDKQNTSAKVDADGHLTSYMADVDSDEKMTPDTEVIKDGVFLESNFRSAPYFNVEIDGITLLDRNYG